MSLFFLLFLLLFLVLPILSMRRAAKRRRELEEEQRRQWEEAQARGEVPPVSPFGLLGDLFGGVLSGSTTGGRSFEYDEQTGDWVETTHDSHEGPAVEDERAPQNAQERRAAAKRARRRRAAAQPQSPLANILGGGMMGGLGGGSGNFEVQHPDELTTFDDVGGMEALKQEIRDTIGLVLQHPDDAARYGIEWNGILLHGPPGVGKTYVAEAIAGEFELNFIHVSTGDLVGSLVGQSAQNIEKAFETAVGHLPCLLFFDEFDSVAQRRDNTPDQESRRTVNQLLTSLEAYRDERRLLVMAATNSIEHLDPAVIRPGRFDRHIRIDLPDAEARRAMFETELDDRPASDAIDLEDRCAGRSPWPAGAR